MRRTRFGSESWRGYCAALGLAAAVFLGACGPDTQTPQETPGVTPPGVIMPVDAGVNEYNLIDRTDPDGLPACTTANLCVLPINGAFWEHPVDANVGTGNLNPFWDTHSTGTSECFNTDFDQPGAGLVLDCARSAWTNELPLNLVPVFFYTPPGGVPTLVRELVWDMNEPNDSPETAQVSIDFFRVYLCADVGTPDPDLYSSVAQVEANCDRVYDIEVGGVSSGIEGRGLAWDGSTQGSGNSLDYRILIPETLFEAQANTASCPYDPDGPDCGLWVIVHAHLGGKGGDDWITSGGFEEMSTVDRPVPARKSGVKFEDLDADGVKDAAEPGLAGWTIYVDLDNDGVLDAGEPFDATDATGFYQINAIPAGTFRVREVAQAGWTCSFPTTTDAFGCYHEEVFEDGDVFENNDFGNFRNGTKSGTKFEDDDADGVFDGTESGLAGWTINAYADTDQNGVLSAGEFAAGAAASDVTDASGDYSLSLAPGGAHAGKYIVCEVLQATWTQSAPGGTDECTGSATLGADGWAITITSGSTDTDNDFGNFQNGTKSGTKFEDDDADGVFDGTESGLAGWTINAYADTDQNGVLSAGEFAAGAAASDVTDASGDYSLSLAPGGAHAGKYIVCEVLQATWTQSAPGGTDECTGSATLGADGWAITITSGSTDTDNDFGNFQNGTKSGTKFEDEDADGVFDGTESGLAGWTINAYADTDQNGVLSAGEFAAGAAATDVTDASGDYSLTLAPGGAHAGKYIVCEVLQATWTQSAPGGTDECTGSATLGADGWAITITSGSTDTDNDFGNFQGGTKSGTKFEDDDADGVFDGTESGLAGWTINAYADTDQNGVLSAGEFAAGAAATDVTDASGDYSLTLAPGGAHAGKYIVCEVLQATWTQSAPGGTDECTGSATLGADGWAITITSGSTDTDNDFGNFQSGTKSGTKFNDADGDGVFDGTESGLSGWTINAYADTDQNGVLSAGEFAAGAAATDVTDASGDYSLTLAPGGTHAGKYIVCEVAQATWTQTAPNNTICLAGSPTLANGGWAITITSGSTDTDNDFGNTIPPESETAYARGTNGNTCFTDFNPPLANNWGWGITVTKGELPEEYQIWAGAAQCNTANGTLVGTLTVSINGQNRIVFSYDLLPGFTLDAIHVYVSLTGFPTSIAPGQFPYSATPGTNDASITTIVASGPSTQVIYFIAHAVVSGPF